LVSDRVRNVVTMLDFIFGKKPSQERVPFGKRFGQKYFNFGSDVVNLNHGSFGAIPQVVLEARINHIKDVMAFPDRFFKSDMFSKVPAIRQKVADIVDADVDNLVFVANATTAVNTILRSYPLAKGDKIVFCNTIYGSCRNTIQFLRDRVGIDAIEVVLEYPMSNQEVVDAFTNAIDSAGGTVKMAFFDAVSSMPACVIPWEELCGECRKRGVLSVVDGAHSIGLIPISLGSARPDFFTSNLHKWLFTPNSCALLYVDREHHHLVHPLPVSAVYLNDGETLDDVKEKTRLGDTFLYTGTVDYSSILSATEAIKFREEVCGGEQAIRKYCFDLAKKGGALVTKEFGTEVLTGKEDHIDTCMINVRVPWDVPEDKLAEALNQYNKYIMEKWNTFVPIAPYKGQLWSRWSAQVYLDLDDFKYGIKAVKDAIANIKV
jgi:selenocysteine lyase/cysteine desulfurase